MYSNELSFAGVIAVTLALVLALLLSFGVFYWLLGVVHCPTDWRGTVALALCATGGARAKFSNG